MRYRSLFCSVVYRLIVVFVFIELSSCLSNLRRSIVTVIHVQVAFIRVDRTEPRLNEACDAKRWLRLVFRIVMSRVVASLTVNRIRERMRRIRDIYNDG